VFQQPDQFLGLTRGNRGVARGHEIQRGAIGHQRLITPPFDVYGKIAKHCTLRAALWRGYQGADSKDRGATMKFDSNQAWNQALASISANRAVLWPVAGVFFLLPGLVWVWFFSDMQATMMAEIAKPANAEQPFHLLTGKFVISILALALIQAIGNMSLLGLFTDRTRPTVGEAIGNAVRCLPTVIGASLLLGVAYIVLITLGIGIIAGILAVIHVKVVAVVLGLALFAGLLYAITRLSLLTPVIIIERVTNPLAAIKRAWALTLGNVGRILAFYLLLLIGYVIIALVVQLGLGAVLGVSMMAGKGMAALSGNNLIVMGLVSGLISLVVAVLVNAILAAIHRQLTTPA
jgi:hypothetical protein